MPMVHRSALSVLMSPQSVAVIGASDDPTRIGGRPIAYMLSQGYAGRILPVNPNRAVIQGLPAFASVADLPEAPELAIIAVAAAGTPAIVAELAARGTRVGVLFSAGFAEAGPAGEALQAQLLAAARSAVAAAAAAGTAPGAPPALRLLGPNSLGVVNPRNGFFGSFVSSVELGMPRPGRVAIVSQSGAYGGHLMCAATAAGIGLSSLIMTGNEADLGLGELVQGLVADAHTDVIALYSEGIRDGDRLVAALQAARAARKPVVMMKVGRSVVGSAAAQSHTASIAGNDAVVDAVLRELGVVRAASTEQMLDIARLATRRIYPVGNTLGVITVSGGAGVIISDAAEALGLPVPEMPAAAQAELRAMLPFASPRNPVDTTAQYMNDMSLVGRFANRLIDAGGYRSVLGFFTYTAGAPSLAPRLRAELKPVRERHPDTLFVLCLQAAPALVQAYEDDGFCVFEDPTRAVTAIAAMGRLGDAFAAPPPGPAPTLGAHVGPALLPAHNPSEADAKRLLAAAGIACAPEQVCTSADQAVTAARALAGRPGAPVVMKILSPDILHKSEIGGVLLGVAGDDAVRAGFATLVQRAAQAAPQARIDGVLVARQLSGGVECILGIQRDPVFGPVALFGLGGVFVEVLQDVVLQRCPFGPEEAERMVRSIRGAPLLLGARGRPVADVAALAAMLSRLSALAVALGPRLQAIDLNPVIALAQGQGAYAVDAVVLVNG